jgi:hypothetical protein
MTTFSKITPKTKLSETQFYSIDKIVGDKLYVVNEDNERIELPKKYVEKCLVTSDNVETTQTMSRTDLTNLFLSSSNVVMTVTYNKKVDEKEVEKAVAALYPNKGGKILSEADFKKQVSSLLKTALDGEERTMVGRHYGNQDEFGRVRFIDMEITKDPKKDYDTRQRLVDTRTISCLILRGVKYCVK